MIGGGTALLRPVFAIVVVVLMLGVPWGSTDTARAATLPLPSTSTPPPTTTTSTPTPPPPEPEVDPFDPLADVGGMFRGGHRSHDQARSTTDLDDLLDRRARFVLDRNWGVRGSEFRAFDSTYPRDGLVSLQWAFDQTPLSGSTSTAAVVVKALGLGATGVMEARFSVHAPGLHYLTLTATWSDGKADRVTTPIHVEDVALQLVQAYDVSASYTPFVRLPVPSGETLQHPANPFVTLQWPNRPTVLLISDFLEPGKAPPLALAPAVADDALRALGSLSEVQPDHGFGAVVASGTTQFGVPLTHVGQRLAQSLASAGLANVAFASGIDAATGALDRVAIRNALTWAKLSGQVDAIVWGLPSAAYLPAVEANAIRPHLNADQTPLLSLNAAGPLPASVASWRKATLLPNDTASVTEFLWTQAFLSADLEPHEDSRLLGDILYEKRDRLSTHAWPLVQAFRNDQRFDVFLQNAVLDLADRGVPFIAPSESCAGLPSNRYMTTLGITELVGVITVADGDKTKPNVQACKGPDRRAAAHGSGVDFYADPRPFGMDPLVAGFAPLAYASNSLGAAAKVGALAARQRYFTSNMVLPWKAGDVLGMLTTKAVPHSTSNPWAEGAGYLDVDNVTLTVPTEFPRTTEIVFTPYDPMRGKATAILQSVVVGASQVNAAEAATADDFSFTGESGIKQRLYVRNTGTLQMDNLNQWHQRKFSFDVAQVEFERVSSALGVSTIVIEMTPAHMPAGGQNPALPPTSWFLPGMYSGRTWISTPSNGILQLPVNLGIGTIVDVHRFLAPDTPVPNEATCLALPFKLLGDLTGLRETFHELDAFNVCIYWTNTDVNGTARFYTPLPLAYDLISFFSGPFAERVKETTLIDGRTVGGGTRTSGPPYYPQIHETLIVPAPVNVTGLANAFDPGEGEGWLEAKTHAFDQGRPATIANNLPYPLGFFPVRLTFPVAISINWVYRDNIEAHHILPIPSVLSPEFLQTLAFLPNPVRQLLTQASGEVDGDSSVPDGLLLSAPEHVNAILGDAHDVVKGAVPLESTYVDSLLSQPVTKALPLNLQAEPGSCTWGYGNQESPMMTGLVDDLFDRSQHHGAGLQTLMARLDEQRGAENYPDSVIMRIQPTLNVLLGLTQALPLCSAVYPFNLPQPNYKSTFIHEFDLHLESALLIVCLTVVDVECYLIAPNPVGDGVFVVAVDTALIDNELGAVLGSEDRTLTDLQDPQVPSSGTVGEAAGAVDGVSRMDLPDRVDLTQDGHVVLEFNQPSYDRDHGFLFYVALPLDLTASGVLDPLVGILERAGINVDVDGPRITLENVPGLGDRHVDAATRLDDLVRDSLTELLRMQAYIEVSRPVFHYDTWWWDDSFFDARISPSRLLPRTEASTLEDANGPFNLAEDFWWLTFPNINREYFERGLRYWDPITLQPDLGRLAADRYPWNQPEYFEVNMQVWDDEHVVDAQMNQVHIHDASTAHDFVVTALHCTEADRADVNPVTGQTCLEGLLAYEEGDPWFVHGDTYGNGIYDPDLGLFGVKLRTLGEIDSLFGRIDNTWDLVWSQQIGAPLFQGPSRPAGEVVATELGRDPRNLTWWKRDNGPVANRAVYSDLHGNSSMLLGTHRKSCEELHDLPGQVALFFDQHPKWRTSCPWRTDAAGAPLVKEPDLSAARLTGTTKNGWEPALRPPRGEGPAPTGLSWSIHRGVHCQRTAWMHWADDADEASRSAAIVAFYERRGVPVSAVVQRSILPMADHCGNQDGWTYWVRAAPTFDGGLTPKWNAFSQVLHPVFYDGTFERDDAAWAACKASPSSFTWPCDAESPMSQLWKDLRGLVAEYDEVVFVDPHTDRTMTIRFSGLEWALLLFGMNYNETFVNQVNGKTVFFGDFPNNKAPGEATGGDHDERYVTVPSAAEWPAFFGNIIFREADANYSRARPHDSFLAVFQDAVTKYAPLLRAWLEGDVGALEDWFRAHGPQVPAWSARSAANPFWLDVSGLRVPWQELSRVRPSTDADEPPLRRADGSRVGNFFACDGSFWLTQCHDREIVLDSGDLTFFGRAGYWGRVAGPKLAFIPQGSSYARFNDQHLVFNATSGVPEGTRDFATGGDRGVCWFDTIDGHGENSLFVHEEFQPLDLVFYDDPHHAGHYNHVEPRAEGFEEPVPSLRTGHWCRNEKGALLAARGQREYIPLRLPVEMMGGNASLTRAPPIMPYALEGSMDFPAIALRVPGNQVTKLALAVVRDAVGIVDSIAGVPLGVAGGLVAGLGAPANALATLRAPDGSALDAGVGAWDVIQQAEDLLPGLSPIVNTTTSSPVVPLARLDLAAGLSAAELVLVHTYDLRPGTHAALLASPDGESWRVLPSRGAPLLMGSAASSRLAFYDVSRFAGSSTLLGTQLVGPGWWLGSWSVDRMAVLPSAVNGAPGPTYHRWDGAMGGFTQLLQPTPASLSELGPGARIRLSGPLVVPEGTTLALEGVTLVVDNCGDYACPITVDGNLTLQDVVVEPVGGTPVDETGVGEGLRIVVHGDLVGVNVTFGGLLAGLQVLGGSVDLSDCWMVQTGHVGILSVFGDVRVRGCVFADQVIGVYALGGHVRAEGNLFYRMVRASVAVDESWGVVRENTLVHSKQGGIYQRSPLAASNLAVFGNWIEDVGFGVGSTLALEDRLLGLDPRTPSVPPSSRTRIQGNWFEWNTLEAIEAGPLGAPVIRGNNVTHSNIGVRVGWLNPASVQYNNLYADRVAWIDPERRTLPPQDGNTWAGLWQLAGLSLPVDASLNYWGRGAIEEGGLWPVDVVRPNGLTDLSQPLDGYVELPLEAALTAPGYGGGLVPRLGNATRGELGAEDALTRITKVAAEAPGSVLDPSLLVDLPLDSVEVLSWTTRPVPVDWDIGGPAEMVEVEGVFYEFLGLPNPDQLETVGDLVEALHDLPIVDPGRVLGSGVTRTVLREIPTGGSTSGTFTFSFDGWKEGRADWRVTRTLVDGEWVPVDPLARKDATIHNSLVWPLLPEMTLLVTDLTRGVLNSAWNVVEETRPATLVPTNAGLWGAAGLPMRRLPDGAIPIDGSPTAFSLARDQDPVAKYEYRAAVGSGPWVSLGSGLGADRVASLPALEDGQTLRLHARAVDASGLTSPWSSAHVLRDSTPPTLSLGPAPACVAVPFEGVSYRAVDPLPGGADRRAGGLQRLRLEARTPQGALADVLDTTNLVGNEASGRWAFPGASASEGAVYVIRGVATDAAGHLASNTTLGIRLDVLPPFFAQLPVVESVPGVPLLLRLAFQALDLGCGLAGVEVVRLVDGVAQPPIMLAPTTTSWLDADTAQLQGHEVAYRLTPIDLVGRRGATVTTTPWRLDGVAPTCSLEGEAPVGWTILDGVVVGPAAGGGTVLSPRPSGLGFRAYASHVNPDVTVTRTLLIDDVDRTSLLQGSSFVYDTSSVAYDKPHSVVLRAVGSNGLVCQVERIVYFPLETVVPMLEDVGAGWVLAPGSGSASLHQAVLSSGADKNVFVRSRDTRESTATWESKLPTAKVVVSAKVYAAYRGCSGRLDLLRVMDGTVPRVSLYLEGCSSSLLRLGRDGFAPVITTQSIASLKWYDVKLVLGSSSVDVYVDGVFLDSWPLGAPVQGVTGVGMRTYNGADGYLDRVSVRMRSFGFYGFHGFQPIVDLAGWTQSGSGSMTAAAEPHGTVLQAAGSASNFRVTSPVFRAGQFTRATAYFRVDGAGSDTVVAGLAGAAGHSIATATVRGDRLFVSNGSALGVPFGPVLVPGAWHRVDLEVSGQEYVATLDRSVNGFRTVQPVSSSARVASFFAGDGTMPFSLDRVRLEVGEGLDHSFTTPLADVTGWAQYTSPGNPGSVQVQTTTPGLVGSGILRVSSGSAVNHQSLAFVPMATFGSRVTLEAAFRVPTGTSSDHIAVVSGLLPAGGNAKWAITVAPSQPVALGLGYLLFLVDERGVPTPLSTTVFPAGAWHSLRVVVDPGAGVLKVWLDEKLVLDKTGLQSTVGGSAYFAFGDAFTAANAKTGSGVIELDDVSVFRG